jgi:two-component system, LytTR family, response regulator
MMRALIVDDEAPARSKLRQLLQEQSDIAIAGECANGPEAVLAAVETPVDVMFLDVEMPDMDGFEVLRLLGDARPPTIVFVTAFDEHAIRAFEVDALDYLLKPFDRGRFEAMLARLRRRASSASADALARLSESRQQYLRRLVAREAGRIVLVPLEEVDWIESANNYVRVHRGGTSTYVRTTLKELEERLDPDHFSRVHRTAIVAIDRIAQIEPVSHGDYRLRLRGGAELPVSRTYNETLRRLLDG